MKTSFLILVIIFSQFCITKSARDKYKKGKIVKIRDYSRFSADSFNNDLSEVDWNRMITNGTSCVNNLFSSFYSKLNKIVNKHAPIKKLSNRKAKQLSKSWITTGLKASISVKNKLYVRIGR